MSGNSDADIMAIARTLVPEAPANWNPIEDDGDAFRLSIKLGIEVGTAKSRGHNRVMRAHFPLSGIAARSACHACSVKPNGDAQAAARRAIVLAAATIVRARA